MNPKIPCASFLLIRFSNISKSTVTYLKYPDEISLFIPFSIIKKKAYLRIFKLLAQFFSSSIFQVLKIAYLRILKFLAQFLCQSLFQILKSILRNLQSPGSIFYSSVFKILKKTYLQMLKIVVKFFCSCLFQLLKKGYL